MGEKLYYQNSYMHEFTTKIIKQQVDDKGDWFVVLEATAFYPTGGGQPFDTGLLNGVKVLNVEEFDGEIRHFIESPLPEDTMVISGQINWDRRFDHMQQHAGQHILSAAFEEIFQFKTVGFHMGNEILTIDLDIEDLTQEQAAQAEYRANQIIIENRTIETKWVEGHDLSNYPLRKIPTVTDNIRLVIIPDFDYNGCGGTHPNTTGQVQAVKILTWERQKKKIRLQFVCGRRVLKQLQNKHEVIQNLTVSLNTPEQSMVQSVARLLEMKNNREKQIEELNQSLLQFEAKELSNEMVQINNTHVIPKSYQDRSLPELQKLARLIIKETTQGIVVLVSENNSQLQLVAARGAEVSLSMKNLLNDLLSLINGKGGGNDSLAQGGGPAEMTADQLLQLALPIIVKQVS